MNERVLIVGAVLAVATVFAGITLLISAELLVPGVQFAQSGGAGRLLFDPSVSEILEFAFPVRSFPVWLQVHGYAGVATMAAVAAVIFWQAGDGGWRFGKVMAVATGWPIVIISMSDIVLNALYPYRRIDADFLMTGMPRAPDFLVAFLDWSQFGLMALVGLWLQLAVMTRLSAHLPARAVIATLGLGAFAFAFWASIANPALIWPVMIGLGIASVGLAGLAIRDATAGVGFALIGSASVVGVGLLLADAGALWRPDTAGLLADTTVATAELHYLAALPLSCALMFGLVDVLRLRIALWVQLAHGAALTAAMILAMTPQAQAGLQGKPMAYPDYPDAFEPFMRAASNASFALFALWAAGAAWILWQALQARARTADQP